jgi:hypothetical protein
MRAAYAKLRRYIATTIHAHYRLFVWLATDTLPDHALAVFARDDDWFFGVLHSRAHEVWSLRLGTWLGVGNDPRYTPTTCFETFPFPRPTDEQRASVAVAERLDGLRRAWLGRAGAVNPAELTRRTLTNPYNARPAWLAGAHAALDRAVWAAYGWPADEEPGAMAKDATLARLLALNLERTRGIDAQQRTCATGS